MDGDLSLVGAVGDSPCGTLFVSELECPCLGLLSTQIGWRCWGMASGLGRFWWFSQLSIVSISGDDTDSDSDCRD